MQSKQFVLDIPDMLVSSYNSTTGELGSEKATVVYYIKEDESTGFIPYFEQVDRAFIQPKVDEGRITLSEYNTKKGNMNIYRSSILFVNMNFTGTILP